MKKFKYDKTNEYLGKAFLLMALWTPVIIHWIVIKQDVNGLTTIVWIWFSYIITRWNNVLLPVRSWEKLVTAW